MFVAVILKRDNDFLWLSLQIVALLVEVEELGFVRIFVSSLYLH